MLVIHQPRVAWDTARIVVQATQDQELFGWLSRRLGDLLGPAVEDDLTATRRRLFLAGDRAPVEAGLWRVRLEDALRARPELAAELAALTDAVRPRMRSAAWMS